MGDLHSIAYSSNCSSSLGWEFQNLGVFNTDMSHSMMGNCSTPPYLSSSDSDYSTGYLQDALFEFSSKRRRLLFFSHHHHSTSPIQDCWEENFNEIYRENFGYVKDTDGVSGNLMDDKNRDSSSSSLNSKVSLAGAGGGTDTGTGEEKKRKSCRVVYPFAVVKPGGREGEVTLNDINQRILMPPTRAVRHPVGDFACRPIIVSPNGPGLSGKAVVALTRLQTQGTGTITIIRTKG